MSNDTDELSDDELLDELGASAEAKSHTGFSAKEARIIAGFEDIVKFVEDHGRPPGHGKGGDIFERLYATRLDALRRQKDCHALLANLDKAGLLSLGAGIEDDTEIDDDELLAELGEPYEGGSDLSKLRHVKPRAEIRAAEEIARRTPCKDFDEFKSLFEAVRADLDTGVRESRPFGKNAEIKQGDFYILGGQITYVAGLGEVLAEYDRLNRRVHLIFDNGTQNDMLLRSFQRALYKDDTGRRITDPAPGPLFGGTAAEGDTQSGTIYVLRSRSDHPFVSQNREILHKIGVTGGNVAQRIANARLDATFLLADVEVVAEYELFNINRSRIENLLHRLFSPGRLDIEIADRFGHPVRPREWFLTPLQAIDNAVSRIRDGSIANVRYDPGTAQLIEDR